LTAILVCAGPESRSTAEEVLTNDTVVDMVRAGLPEAVIIQKIRTAPRKFDTSTAALIQLKGAGVPGQVIEAMVMEPGLASPPAPQGGVAAAPTEPLISHVTANGGQVLKFVHGVMQVKVEPFVGSRQEVVLPEPQAAYRMTEKEPVFSTPQTAEQWVLARLKPGRRDRNLPMNKNAGWWWGAAYATRAYQHGVDPKYVIGLIAEPGPSGGTQLKPARPLAPGEYGFVAVTRGQPNLVEVFVFGVD
jgi:hypothetical protein